MRASGLLDAELFQDDGHQLLADFAMTRQRGLPAAQVDLGVPRAFHELCAEPGQVPLELLGFQGPSLKQKRPSWYDRVVESTLGVNTFVYLFDVPGALVQRSIQARRRRR